MPSQHQRPSADSRESEVEESLDSETVVLWWIAGLLIAGAAWLLAPILVPFVLGLVLAIALSPVAGWLERLGLGRTVSSLICLVLVACVLVATTGLIAYQAGTILQQSDRYIDRLSRMMASVARAVGGDRLLTSLGAIQAESESPPGASGEQPSPSAGPSPGAGGGTRPGNQKPDTPPDQLTYWARFLRENLGLVGGWLVRGIGGFVGLVGSAVILLSFLFYLLLTRAEWVDRLSRVLLSLGLRPRRDGLERIRSGITVYAGFVVLVSVCGAAVIGTTAWLLGVPQPYLWGLVFGLLEFVPYFGPMVGGSLLTLVALTTGSGGWWQPLIMLGVILAWLTLEGYVIAPMVYGRAVRFDPVTILASILLFGWLWGPLGMVTALPAMVVLREFVAMVPETPVLDALMEPEPESGAAVHASA
jgi:predicted PurR-regulated permease PerM